MEIVEGLHRLDAGLGVNAYLWNPAGARASARDGTAPLLFDCGWPWSGRRLVRELAALGVRPAQIRVIALTHDDVDHSGRLAALQAVSGARIVTHEAEAPRLSRERWRFLPHTGPPAVIADGVTRLLYAPWRRHPVRVSFPVQDGVELQGGWLVVHTPGHTPGHTSYFHPRLRVAIVGDALGSPRAAVPFGMRRAAPESAEFAGILRPPARLYAEDWGMAVASVWKLAELKPAILCFGHGPVVRNAAMPLRGLAACLRMRSER